LYSAHLHLLLNHWPIIGSYIGLGLLLVSLIGRQDQLQQGSLGLISFLSLLSIPAYMSGNSAQLFLKETPDIPMDLVQSHQGAAFIALILMEITGAFALYGVWQFSRTGASSKSKEGSRPPAWNVAVVLLLSLATCVLMAIAGNTGGEIRHPEILSDPAAASKAGALGASLLPGIEHFVIQSSMWVWPILEDLHFFGLILIVATIGLLNLRILGFLKKLPVAPLHRFIPLGIVGVYINIITGMFFFIGMPPFYSNNIAFQLKMLTVVVAGTNLMIFYCTSAFLKLAKLGPGDNAPIWARLVAFSSLFLWISLIVMGRYLPFFEVLQ